MDQSQARVIHIDSRPVGHFGDFDFLAESLSALLQALGCFLQADHRLERNAYRDTGREGLFAGGSRVRAVLQNQRATPRLASVGRERERLVLCGHVDRL